MLPSLYITSDGAYLPHLRPKVGVLQDQPAKLYICKPFLFVHTLDTCLKSTTVQTVNVCYELDI